MALTIHGMSLSIRALSVRTCRGFLWCLSRTVNHTICWLGSMALVPGLKVDQFLRVSRLCFNHDHPCLCRAIIENLNISNLGEKDQLKKNNGMRMVNDGLRVLI